MSRVAVRLFVGLAVAASSLVLAVAANAQACSPDADPPVDVGAEIRAHGSVDCNTADEGDVLTVKLWRRVDFGFDDFWDDDTDTYPPDLSGNVYDARASGCETSDPPDDFLTEVRGNGDLQNVIADAISGSSNLNC